MSNFMIALLVSISAGTWIYLKMQNKTGGISSTSAIVAGIAAVILFVLLLTVLGFVLS